MPAVRHLVPSRAEQERLRQVLPKLESSGRYPDLVAALRECVGPDEAQPAAGASTAELYLARRENRQLRQDLQTITMSRSWQWTAPLRRIAGAVRSITKDIRSRVSS